MNKTLMISCAALALAAPALASGGTSGGGGGTKTTTTSGGGGTSGGGITTTTGGGGTTTTGGGGGGGGGGGTALFQTTGLFVTNAPKIGEASVTGVVSWRQAGTFTINGVPLTDGGTGVWSVDPAGPQPVLGPDRILHLVATPAGAKPGVNRALDVQCPNEEVLTMSIPEGSSLVAPTTLTVTWGETLPGNSLTALARMYSAGITLSGYDPATQAYPLGGGALADIGTGIGPDGSAVGPTGVFLNVSPTTAPAWEFEMSYPGPYAQDGVDDAGTCFMKIRKFFSN